MLIIREMKIIFKIILFLIIISNKKPKIFKYHNWSHRSYTQSFLFSYSCLIKFEKR